MPNMVGRVKFYTKDYPIFDEYGVQNEIDKALRSKVWLKSGGYIVINQTEALVAIDVNTGRYVGKKTAGRLEDTIVKTNLEACKEIVRQVRLRDLGGIIVLDFIDMEEKKNRQKVAQAIEQELRKDRAPSKSVQVSDFGLIIITRKRVKSSLERTADRAVPVLLGHGHDQDERDDLLRHSDRGQEGQRRPRRLQPRAARQSGDRAGAQGREPQRVSRTGGRRGAFGHRAPGRATPSRAVRRDGHLSGYNQKKEAPMTRYGFVGIASAIAVTAVLAHPALIEAKGAVALQGQTSTQAVTLGTAHIPRKVMANGEPLAAGTYTLRLSTDEVTPVAGEAPGSEKWVEFVQAGKVKGKELASVMTTAGAKAIAERGVPASGTVKVEALKGNDYLRVWVNKGGTNYLIHLDAGS